MAAQKCLVYEYKITTQLLAKIVRADMAPSDISIYVHNVSIATVLIPC